MKSISRFTWWVCDYAAKVGPVSQMNSFRGVSLGIGVVVLSCGRTMIVHTSPNCMNKAERGSSRACWYP
jgi:hypothetical protein